MKGALAPKRYELERNSFIALISDLRLWVPSRAVSTVVDRHELPPRGAGVELARPADLVFGVADHLLPLRDPAYRAREGKNASEHRHRDAERALHDPRIEIDVRVELALDEIIVLERDLLQREGELEEAIVPQAELLQHLMAGFAHELCPRIVVLVDAVPEAHEAHARVLVLRALDEFPDPGHIADLLQHLQAGFVGAAVSRAPQRHDSRGDAGKRIGARGTREPHGRGGSVLLVIGVEDENAVQGPHQDRVQLVFFG